MGDGGGGGVEMFVGCGMRSVEGAGGAGGGGVTNTGMSSLYGEDGDG